MKISYNSIKFMIICLVFTNLNCRKDGIGPVGGSNVPPGPVSNAKVENEHGKAVISYTMPSNANLLYVKAVYEYAKGKTKEVKSSYYNNYLTVDGFADTLTHEVKLYAVTRNEIESKAVSVNVKPLTPPILEVFKTLKVAADFGGINVQAINQYKDNIAIVVLKKDSLNHWQNITNVYSSSDSINSTYRGLDTVKQQFAFYVRDRWLNQTDTLFANLVPLYETILDISKFRALSLPTDVEANIWTHSTVATLWDNDYYYWPKCVCTNPKILTPQWLSFDIGQTPTLSRIVIWDYPEYLTAGRTYYYGGDMKNFEIWGSNNPDADGGWTNWTRLIEGVESKPSGSAYGTQTDDDFQAARAGFSYSFPSNTNYRYLRIKCLKNWSGLTYMTISEIRLYGQSEK